MGTPGRGEHPPGRGDSVCPQGLCQVRCRSESRTSRGGRCFPANTCSGWCGMLSRGQALCAQLTPADLTPPGSLSSLPTQFQLSASVQETQRCRSQVDSHGSTSGSSGHRQQRSHPANAPQGRDLVGVRSPPGRSHSWTGDATPQMLFQRAEGAACHYSLLVGH